jgi:Tfp pilus assembly protein PilX
MNNEKGSAIVLALILLAVMSIIGISAATNSTIESKIVRNEKIYQQNSYFAEASVYEAAQRIELSPEPAIQLSPETTEYDWLNDDTVEFSSAGAWQDFGLASGHINDNCDVSVIDPTQTGSSNQKPSVFFAVVNKGIRPGSSLDIGATRVYEFRVFGKAEWQGGLSIVEIGYLKRF